MPKGAAAMLGQIKDIELQLPFNYSGHQWAEKNFDATYKAQWVPQKIPTLIFSGDIDRITPLRIFSELNEFQGKNILMREIKDASYFTWMENPETVRYFSLTIVNG